MARYTKEIRWFPEVSERHYGLLVSGLFFWAGCVLAERLAGGGWLWLLLALAVTLGFLLRLRNRRMSAALAVAMLALGALRATPLLNPPTPQPGAYQTITGDVYGGVRLRADRRMSFALTNVALDGVPQTGRAYCSLYYGKAGMPQLYDGAALSFTGRVYLPEGRSGPPRFDFRRWMLQNGMSYGIAISQGVTEMNTPEAAPVRDWAYRLRERLKGALQTTMGDGAGLAVAMLLGEKEGVAEQEYAAFQKLGVAHVMAVSGLHVGLLGNVLLLLMNKLRFNKRLQLMLLGAFLILYSGLTGFSAAALRASVMLMLMLLAQRWGRRTDALTTLGAAVLTVLVVDPLQATAIGFILSFSAVFGIMALTPTFRRMLERLWPDKQIRACRTVSEHIWAAGARLLRWFKQSLSVSLAAQLGVLLPTAMFFHSLPLYGVAVNLVVIPYVGLLVPIYAAALLLSPVPVLGEWVGTAAAWLGNGLKWLVEALSALPYASVRTASPAVVWIAVVMVVMVLMSRVIRAPAWRRLLAGGLACMAAWAATYATRPPDTRYVQLAVGQADAALIFAGNQTVALDVGADGDATLDYLMDTGRNLDALILTHLHLDHAGGVAALLEAGIHIRQAYLPLNAEAQRLEDDSVAILKLLEENGIPVVRLARGDELRYNGVAIRALWPDRETPRVGQDANDLPLVLSVDMDGFSVLCASDLTGSYERYAAAPCDVLKVAHHGSSASTLEDFLEFVRPGMALISCSSGSRTLPGAETLARLEAKGVPMLRTDRAGDITLWVEKGALHIKPYR